MGPPGDSLLLVYARLCGMGPPGEREFIVNNLQFTVYCLLIEVPDQSGLRLIGRDGTAGEISCGDGFVQLLFYNFEVFLVYATDSYS